MVSERVPLEFAHPPVPVTVYVIMTTPAPIAEMSPLLGLMVANAELLLLHTPPTAVEVN